jgi:hypothetical protein
MNLDPSSFAVAHIVAIVVSVEIQINAFKEQMYSTSSCVMQNEQAVHMKRSGQLFIGLGLCHYLTNSAAAEPYADRPGLLRTLFEQSIEECGVKADIARHCNTLHEPRKHLLGTFLSIYIVERTAPILVNTLGRYDARTTMYGDGV